MNKNRFDEAQAVADDIRQICDQYIGCEVLENTGRGYNMAIITHMEFNHSVYDRRASKWGAFVYTIRYLHDGSQTVTCDDQMELTGEKYTDIDAVRPLAVINGIIWS